MSVLNIIYSLLLGLFAIYVGSFFSYLIQSFIINRIISSILSNEESRIKILEYSYRFLIGFIIGCIHASLVINGLNIYVIMTIYLIYIIFSFELPFGNLYNNLYNFNDETIFGESLKLAEMKIRKIKLTLRSMNLCGYLISMFLFISL